MTRVLAFTPSLDGRFFLLDRCIKQMQLQTHPVSHSVHLNTPEPADTPLLARIASRLAEDNAAHGAPSISVGISGHHHHLHSVRALRNMDMDAYDLFVKVDDDDYYGPRYVEHCVADFEHIGWDFSGCHSVGAFEQSRWWPDLVIEDLGRGEEDYALGVPAVMPPTMAFSRAAIEIMIELEPDPTLYDDQMWRRAICARSDLKIAVRDQQDFMYNAYKGSHSRP